MRAFFDAGILDRIKPGDGVAVSIGNDTFAIFVDERNIVALEGWCLRCGTCLAKAHLHGHVIACGGCDWRYDVTTGSVLGVPALRLQVFIASVTDGKIVIANA